MNQPVQLAALRGTGEAPPKPHTIFDYLEDDRVKKGIGAVAGKFLTPDRMLRLCINAIKRTPRLAQCDPQSVLGAIMASTALGLEPNTPQQQAFLIPYKKRGQVNGKWQDVYVCEFQVGARGYVTLAYRSPHIKSLDAECVRERDLWEHEQGSKSFLRYAKALKDRGEAIGAFSYVRLTDGHESACVLPLEELFKIRSKSDAWKNAAAALDEAQDGKERQTAQKALEETPWVMWFDDMASKSAIKKHAKRLPLASNDSMAVAASLDGDGETGALDLSTLTDPDMVREVVAGNADVPMLAEDAPEVVIPTETFGTRDRQPVPVQRGATHTQQGMRESTPTGPAPGPDDDEPRFDPDAFEERMRRASSLDELDVMADDIRSLVDGAVKTRLEATYDRLRRTLENSARPDAPASRDLLGPTPSPSPSPAGRAPRTSSHRIGGEIK